MSTNKSLKLMLKLPRVWQAASVTALLASTSLVQAALVNEWTGDNFNGTTWSDDVGSLALNTVTTGGTPLKVTSAFNGHAGVNVNGGYFTIPAANGTAGQTNFTVAVVIKPTALGPFTPNYYNAIPLAAFDIGGSGQIDWGLSYGDNAGHGVVTGAGQQTLLNAANGDVLQVTPPLALYGTHAVVYQVNGAARTIETFVDGAMVASNSVTSITPRSGANIVYVGGGQFVSQTFPGQIAAIQLYNDATINAASLSQSLLATYSGGAVAVTLPYAQGADPGQNASFSVTVPASLVASGPLTLTFTSDNTNVAGNTSLNFPQGVNIETLTVPILAIGIANFTATGTSVAPTIMTIAGLDESGLAEQWLGDNYVNNATNWVDDIAHVSAAGSGAEVAIPNAFGTHQGVSKNANGTANDNSGFNIPGGTVPAGITNYTLVIAFKPTVTYIGANFYNGQIMLGYDIANSGQHDFGISWGGSGGQQVTCGIGRNGGDSTLATPGSLPLALNATHVLAMQVNGQTGVQSLWIDGYLAGQNTGLTMLAPSTQPIPLIATLNANIGNAFTGLIGEVRIYSNAAINAQALTAELQNNYAGLPFLAASSSQPYSEIGGTVPISVIIPASLTFNGSYSLTLTSDNTSVVASTTLNFAKGVTSNSVNVTALVDGTANITISGSGVNPATIAVGGLAPRVIVEAFRASSLPNQGYQDGDAVGIPNGWAGDTNNGVIAYPLTSSAPAPVFKASATPAGTPSVVFTGANSTALEIAAPSDPVGGFKNFSVVMVFKDVAPGVGSQNWFSETGIVDAEQSGTVDDWGTTVDSTGAFNFGVGNPDVTLQFPGYSVVNSSVFHATVAAADVLNGQTRLTVDDQGTTVSSPATAISHDPRNASYVVFGKSGNNAQYWTGELVEVDFYNGALTPAEATNAINALQSAYGILFADKAAIQLTSAGTTEDIGSNITFAVTIPQGVNASQPVSVTVTSSNPNAVTVGGGASATITFAAGATNIQTFNVLVVGGGTSTISASSSGGLLPASIDIKGIPAPAIVEAFRASSLTNQLGGLASGGQVTSWAGDTNANGLVIAIPNTTAPTFKTPATPSGAPSVVFAGANSLLLPGITNGTPVSPVAGLTDFSVVLVFKSPAAATASAQQWYTQAGIVDAEETGNHPDWGTTIDTNGQFNFGVGDPDTTLAFTGDNLVTSSYYHVAVAAFDELHQSMQITVDNQPTQATPQFIGLSTFPRDPYYDQESGGDIHFGQGADDGQFWNGEIVEVDFYNGAIKNPAAIINALASSYGVAFQPHSTTVPLAITRAGSSITLTWPSGTLQQSATAAGPYTAVPGAVSPYVTSAAGAQQFYRVHP